MPELETSLHLFQPPLYRAPDGTWHESFAEAVSRAGRELTWDPAALLSVLAFNYVCGDRTLFREIRRRPWLSQIDPSGRVELQTVPPHDTKWISSAPAAARLRILLEREALGVCADRERIFVLLSGGLDSRIVAATLASLFRQGKLRSRPVAVTWGDPQSRDCRYARQAAEILEIDWRHVELGEDDLLRNVRDAATHLGALISPLHLHRMSWFETVPPDSLVLAGSYGDMVGRAEFSGKRLLELRPLEVKDRWALLRREVYPEGYAGLRTDLLALRERADRAPQFAVCEQEMAGHYMRGLIAHAMSIINTYCRVYQLFTDPSVYSFMWSIHPALRFDGVYATLLEQLEPRLARLPWARTNRALRGRTAGAIGGLRRDFHEYARWVSGPVYEELGHWVDPQWFDQTGVFDAQRVEELSRLVRRGVGTGRNPGNWPFELWCWLASLRQLHDWLGEQGRTITRPAPPQGPAAGSREPRPAHLDALRLAAQRSGPLIDAFRRARRTWVRGFSLVRYPPKLTGAPQREGSASAPSRGPKGSA